MEGGAVPATRAAIKWPDVGAFQDHWSWRPEWTSDRPRLLWYLLFGDHPDLLSATAPLADALRQTGADVVPPEWLHLTVTDLGFPDELDADAAEASADVVRDALLGESALDLTLGPLAVLPGAVVLAAHPVESMLRLSEAVRRSMEGVGVLPPRDVDGEYWPHVSLCYVNDRTDQTQLWEVVRSADDCTVQLRCERLAQVLVTRADGHYRWRVVATVPLGS